jgi:V-type H+-transporting ATPase subunit F
VNVFVSLDIATIRTIMASSNSDYKDRQFLAVIGDEVSPPGRYTRRILCGQIHWRNQGLGDWIVARRHRGKAHVTAGAEAEKNFLVVDNKTETAAIESAFDRFTEERKDIGIVLINQHVSRATEGRLAVHLADSLRSPTKYDTASIHTPPPSPPY